MVKRTHSNPRRPFRRGGRLGGDRLLRCLALTGLAPLATGCTGLVPGLPI